MPGSSIATYAAAAGLPCRIYVPATAPRGKIVQIAASGAEVRVDPGHPPGGHRGGARGSRRQLLRQPQLAAVLYRGHQDARLRIVGAARLRGARQHPRADRLRQQHSRPRPRLRRTARSGEITRRPRLFAVQAANCAAFAAAWAAGAEGYVPFTPGVTVADGIATVKPVRTAEVLGSAAPLGGRRRRRAGGRDRPGAQRARPPRPLRRADRGDGRRGIVAAAARRARSGPTKPRSSSSPATASRRPTRSPNCSGSKRTPSPPPGERVGVRDGPARVIARTHPHPAAAFAPATLSRGAGEGLNPAPRRGRRRRPSGRGYRGARARSSPARSLPDSTIWPSFITRISCAIARTTLRSWLMNR